VRERIEERERRRDFYRWGMAVERKAVEEA